MTTTTLPWGRLLIAGGTDFAILGRKEKTGAKAGSLERPDLESAHIVRSVANVKFTKAFASHSGCHAVFLDIDGRAWFIGRNEHEQLTYPLPSSYTTQIDGFPSDTPSASLPFLLNNLSDTAAPPELKAQKIVEAAVGRNHTILITESGQAWAAGWNSHGQCGQPVSMEHVSNFTRIGGSLLNQVVTSAAAGLNFTIFLTEKGQVYAIGSGEKGQLGNGKTGEYIASAKILFQTQSDPLLITATIGSKNIVQIACGQQHAIALDDEGFCYAWGFGGLGRLGMGSQFDCLIPTIIPVYSGSNVITRATQITAGGSNSSFICGQGMYSLCGKWKTSGDGSAGQPWMAPKLVQEIQGYKWNLLSSGGVTLFAATHDKQAGDMVVSWGQSASHGELAQGDGAVRSAVKPMRIDSLDGIHMLSIAAGQNTTYFIARPPPTAAELAAVPPPAPAPPVVPHVAPIILTSADKPKNAEVAVDLSGFGYSFAPPPVVVAVTSKATLPAKPTGTSRTETAPWEELSRFPELVDAVSEACAICEKEEEEQEALECEKCERAYHLECLKLAAIPDGEWFCPECLVEPVAPVHEHNTKKRKAPEKKAFGANKKK